MGYETAIGPRTAGTAAMAHLMDATGKTASYTVIGGSFGFVGLYHDLHTPHTRRRDACGQSFRNHLWSQDAECVSRIAQLHLAFAPICCARRIERVASSAQSLSHRAPKRLDVGLRPVASHVHHGRRHR